MADPVVSGSGTGLTLAVTSSTGIMGLGLGRVTGDGVEQLAEVEVVTDRRHAEEISPRMAELLAGAGVAMADLDRLVIDIGPGRFTGLRVGLATVRALAFALDLPVIGLTSLAVLATGHPDFRPGPVTAVIDARRSEVFQQTFNDGSPIGEPLVGKPEDLAELVAGTVIGDGVDRYLDQYRDLAEAAGVVAVTGVVPRASTMVAMSAGHDGLPGPQVEPLYLREPDAKPNIKTRVGTEPAAAAARGRS